MDECKSHLRNVVEAETTAQGGLMFRQVNDCGLVIAGMVEETKTGYDMACLCFEKGRQAIFELRQEDQTRLGLPGMREIQVTYSGHTEEGGQNDYIVNGSDEFLGEELRINHREHVGMKFRLLEVGAEAVSSFFGIEEIRTSEHEYPTEALPVVVVPVTEAIFSRSLVGAGAVVSVLLVVVGFAFF